MNEYLYCVSHKIAGQSNVNAAKQVLGPSDRLCNVVPRLCTALGAQEEPPPQRDGTSPWGGHPPPKEVAHLLGGSGPPPKEMQCA